MEIYGEKGITLLDIGHNYIQNMVKNLGKKGNAGLKKFGKIWTKEH